LHLTWPPRADGVFLTDHPQRLVQDGKVANIPYITGELKLEPIHRLHLLTAIRQLRRRRDIVFPIFTQRDVSIIPGIPRQKNELHSHSTDAQAVDYFQNVFIPGSSDDQIGQLSALYPADITAGSPFDTGYLNAVTPQFKRIAAVQGDGAFQAPRRWLLKNTSGKQNIWVFCKWTIFE